MADAATRHHPGRRPCRWPSSRPRCPFLRAQGLRAELLIGHSQGKIAALVAGGWLSVEDASRLLCEREVRLCELSPETLAAEFV
jgi:acyl transferase domain-containing protein